MSRATILDTGPLVALLDHGDRHHEWARARISEMPAPLLTCEPVLAEACWLLRRLAGGPAGVIDLVRRRALRVAIDVEAEADSIHELIVRHANVPMSLADACIVRMSELEPRARVLTVDADFRIYRRLGRRVVPTDMPSGT